MKTRASSASAATPCAARRAPDIIVGSWCSKKFRPEHIAARVGWQDVPALVDGVAQLHGIFSHWVAHHG